MNIPVEFLAVALTALTLFTGYLFKMVIDTQKDLAVCKTEVENLKEKTEDMPGTEKEVTRMAEAIENINGRLERIETSLNELARKK